MNKGLRVVLIVIAAIVAAGTLLLAGMAIDRYASASLVGWPSGMARSFFGGTFDRAGRFGGMGPGMMQGYGAGGFTGGMTPALAPGAGVGRTWGGYGAGGMMGYRAGGTIGRGMTPAPAPGAGVGYGAPSAAGLSNLEPLSLDQAAGAVKAYLASLGDENLTLGEIMIFDNQAYAQILESDTGFGAQEVLVDPVTLAVYPEYGPNMMWNQKYGMMGHMGSFGDSLAGAVGSPEDMPVTADEAVAKAQAYLTSYLPGTSVEEADPFYGYYTLDILRAGEPIGMLSVHGYTGQVFVHTWHGHFVEMAEAGIG
ncbi:MAG TPA: hypothetical protein VJ160_08860 [Anaerolineales bacterium]|nr:hypothetical protein [Anaerolineales bacterium]